MNSPPPIPRQHHVHVAHGDERPDDWAWLSDRSNGEVEKVLHQQNAYTRHQLEAVHPLAERIYEETKSRIQEDDETVPASLGEWAYFRRTREGSQYEEHWRRHETGTEQLILNENELAGMSGTDYLDIGVLAISPNQELLAYGADFDGSERFRVRFRSLADGTERSDQLLGAYYGCAWGADNSTFYYVVVDHAMRPYRLMRHRLGTSQAEDHVVFEEADDRFFLHVGKTRSRDLVVITVSSKITSEVHVIDAHDPDGRPRLIAERRENVMYEVDHHRESSRLFVMTNDGATNFRLMTAPLSTPGADSWEAVLPADDGIRLESIDAFAEFVVLSERAQGNQRLRVLDLTTDELHTIEQDEPVYSVWVGTNLEYETRTLRFGYTSLVTPSSVFDYDTRKRIRTLRKQQRVLGDFKRAHYESRREWATAEDGTLVPISVVFHRDTPLDGSAPLLQYGYGAYEISIDPSFSTTRLSLLDRGFVYAIAHVRGGGEMGRGWYEDGKLFNKRNTFSDFLACTEHLLGEGYASAGRVVIRGGSAGGTLMGAVTNMAPDLYAAVIAEVPFVDCLTTMLNDSLPLTITEYDEWGDPNDVDSYEYIKSYSPFDNVTEQPYPNMLVTAGWNDSRVSYWEPVKWVARIRDKSTSGAPVLLRIEMGAGHSGPSGRYDVWREEAETLAFAAKQVGVQV